MKLSLRQLLSTYDFLKEKVSPELAVKLLEDHFEKQQVIVEQNGSGIQGVAVCWQIEDPFDVQVNGSLLPRCKGGEKALGKYAYLPFIFVEEKFRGVRLLRRLLGRVVQHCPGAQRIAYHRPSAGNRIGRLHVIEVKHGQG